MKLGVKELNQCFCFRHKLLLGLNQVPLVKRHLNFKDFDDNPIYTGCSYFNNVLATMLTLELFNLKLILQLAVYKDIVQECI